MRKDLLQILVYPKTHFRRAIADKITHRVSGVMTTDVPEAFWNCRVYSLAVLLHCLSGAPRNIVFLYISGKVFASKLIPLWTKQQEIFTRCSTKLLVWFGMGHAQSHLVGGYTDTK